MTTSNGFRNILILAGRKSHGGDGNGIHDYPVEARTIAALLAASDIAGQVTCTILDDGDWPDVTQLDRADAVVVLSDGRDGDQPFAVATHLAEPSRQGALSRLQARGGGLVVLHFGLFADQAQAPWVLDHLGGYFQWQDDHGARNWTSRITDIETEVVPTGTHPVLAGLEPFRLHEEFYHDLTLTDDGRSTVLLAVPALPIGRERGEVIAWTREPVGGGRAFATSLGHATANWKVAAYRRLLLNGIAWAAGCALPEKGITAPWIAPGDVPRILGGNPEAPVRVLLLAGNDAHRWHNWETTSPLIAAALQHDARLKVTVTTDPNALGNLTGIGCVVLNYCNWHDPAGLPEAVREHFLAWVEAGGGLVVLHFSNGAFHHSLPNAAASDWPGYRRLVRRVWDHAGPSGHDHHRQFTVRFGGREHPATAGLPSFSTEDELYVRQVGDEPIEPLCWAHSEVTGKDEPLAWSYRVGRGRVFQSLLGHDERAYRAWPVREMLRGAVAWCAGLPVRRIAVSDDQPSLTAHFEGAT